MTKHFKQPFAAARSPFERKEADHNPALDTTEIKKGLEVFMKAFGEHQTKVDAELAELKKGKSPDVVTAAEFKKLNDEMDVQKKLVTDLRLELARPQASGKDGQKLTADQIAHKEAVYKYMRTGDDTGLNDLAKKALQIGVDPDGGYTVNAEMESTVDRVLSQVSPIRGISQVMQISTAMLKRPINVGGTGSGWVGETSARPETNTPVLRERQYPVMELYAMPSATQSILDDSVVNLEAWLADEVNITFAEQESIAFINGNGVDRPRGFIGGYTPMTEASFVETGTGPGYIATGVNGDFASGTGADANNLIDLVYALKSAYRQNARFVMNRDVQRRVRRMQDTTGQKVWQQGLTAGQPDTLLGYPVVEAEDMPAVATNSFSIAFGDFQRAYIVVDRVGIRVLRDPFSAKPYILFYTTKRVGGGVKLFEAYKLLRFATS